MKRVAPNRGLSNIDRQVKCAFLQMVLENQYMGLIESEPGYSIEVDVFYNLCAGGRIPFKQRLLRDMNGQRSPTLLCCMSVNARESFVDWVPF